MELTGSDHAEFPVTTTATSPISLMASSTSTTFAHSLGRSRLVLSSSSRVRRNQRRRAMDSSRTSLRVRIGGFVGTCAHPGRTPECRPLVHAGQESARDRTRRWSASGRLGRGGPSPPPGARLSQPVRRAGAIPSVGIGRSVGSCWSLGRDALVAVRRLLGLASMVSATTPLTRTRR